MTSKLKIWHLIFAICLTLLILNYGLVIKTYYLIIIYLQMILENYPRAISQLELSLIDSFASAILVVIVPIFVYLLRKRVKIFYVSLNFTSAAIIILISFFIFAPFANFLMGSR